MLRHTEVFSLAGHKLPGQLNCDIFGRMPALRILNLDGVEFGKRGIEQELPSLAHLTWRYGRAARFPFALEAIKIGRRAHHARRDLPAGAAGRPAGAGNAKFLCPSSRMANVFHISWCHGI